MNKISGRKKWFGLIGWLVISFVAAGFGAVASIHAAEFYQGLVRPPWAPPGWLFGPVWSVLYTAMGISAWLVWVKQGFSGARAGLWLFMAQLMANGLWSWLFFAWHRGAPAFIDVVVLWVLILCTVVAFWRVRPVAGVLLLPYLAWVSFASALCYTTWKLNPGIFG